MSDIVLQKNLGALIDTKSLLSAPYSWTAGGGSDSISFTSSSVDREGLATGSMPLSCDIEVFYSATLGSGQTLSFSLDVQTGPDNSTWTDYATEASTVVVTGPSGGGLVSGVARLVVPSSNNPGNTPGISLAGANRYLRVAGIPHMSRTGTDTAVIQAIGITFGGFDQLVAPAT
jgi:hypothetical protein